MKKIPALLLLLVLSAPARGEVDPEEAGILHRRGREAFLAGRDGEAARDLGRLTSLYPADPRSLGSLPLLGESLSRLGRNEEAIEAFRAYAERAKETSERLRAWIRVGEIRLRSGKTDEALLTARDVLAKGRAAGGMGRGLETDARLLEIDALLSRSRSREADQALNSLVRFLTAREREDGSIGPRILDREIARDARGCKAFDAFPPISEEKLLAAVREESRCLIEALQRAALRTAAHLDWLTPDFSPFEAAFASFHSRLRAPPPSPEAKTPAQAKEYRAQITALLAREGESLRARVLEWVEAREKEIAWSSRALGEKIREAALR